MVQTQRDKMEREEREALVRNYSTLKDFPRSDEALFRLKKIASFAKPIMRNRGWRLPLLAEFYPADPTLRGVNWNHGQKICLRLRYPGDRNQFLPFEDTLDTMLHELSHIVHGPHDEKFQALWDQLREEAEDLIVKGYTGEGFLGKGHVIGGSNRRLPPPQALQQQRRAGRSGGVAVRPQPGHRLGGAAAGPRDDIRAVIARAAETRAAQTAIRPKKPDSRRPTWLREQASGSASGEGPSRAGGSSAMSPTTGCGNVGHTEREIIEIVDDAESHGLRTKAEEDVATDAAIARALAEEWAYEEAHQPVPGAGEWSCPQCTLLNPVTCKTCQACAFKVS